VPWRPAHISTSRISSFAPFGLRPKGAANEPTINARVQTQGTCSSVGRDCPLDLQIRWHEAVLGGQQAMIVQEGTLAPR
jgi:hypothetical protein